jgi:phospholipid/cholesterol/gamma-HCH transport system substrate-binding protein
METRANYATIGIFTLGVIIACFAFVYWLARYDESGARKPMRILIPGSVTGLATGSQVLFNGIRIGDVTSLRINAQDPNEVEAMISVDPSQPVKKDTKVSIGIQGLTGVASIEFLGGSPSEPSIFDQEGIPTLRAQPGGLQDLMASAQNLLNKVNSAADRVNGILDTAEPTVKTSLGNIQTFTDALAKNSAGVDEFMGNVGDLSKKIGALSGDLQGLVAKADKIVASVDPQKVSDTLNHIETISGEIAKSSDQFPEIVANVKTVSGQLSTALTSTQKILDAIPVEKVQSALTDIATVATRVQTATVDIDKMVDNARKALADTRDFVSFVNGKQPEFNTIVANSDSLVKRLNDASAKIDGLLGSAQNMLNDPNGKSFFQEATAAAHSIRVIAEAFQNRAGQIADNLANFTGPGLRNVDGLVNQLQRTTSKFDQTLNSIQSNPQGFVFGNSTVKEYNRK